MKYGQYSDLVEEVFDFMNNGSLISVTTQKITNAIVIHDIKKAQEYAWSQELDDRLPWVDLRERESGKLLGKSYTSEELKVIRGNIKNAARNSEKGIEKRLKGEYEDLFDDITADLCNCAINRAFNGNIDNLFEKMFQIYKIGGWPCGWQGEYPSGEIIAYFPD